MRVWPLIFIAFLAACTTTATAPTPFTVPLSEGELLPFAQEGKRVISGEGFIRLRSSGTVRCSGAPVTLLPAVPMVDAAMERWRTGGKIDPASLPIAHLGSAVRRTECSRSGRFKFERLPALDYWVTLPVTWQERRYRSGIAWDRGGMLAARISVRKHSHKRVVVDNEDWSGGADPELLAAHLGAR
ncbi:MAG: hypothetical protein AAGF49_08610 [Pseudomonadota bacterium]